MHRPALALAAALLAAAACAATPRAQPVTTGAPGPTATTTVTTTVAPPRVLGYVFSCDDGARFSVRYDAPAPGAARSGLTLRLAGGPADRELRLGLDTAASGARYRGRDAAGEVTFWEHQGEATLAGAGLPTRLCRPQEAATAWDEARLLGDDYRAVGQEPGWTVAVDEERRILFVGDYGSVRVTVPAPPPATETAGAKRVTYTARTEGHTLVVEVTRQACRDDMSGERFPTTVVVRLDGREYRGCGRWLGATPRN